MFKPVNCPFCQAQLPEPDNYNNMYTCTCGARWIILAQGDDFDEAEAGEEFGLDSDLVDIKVVPDFDVVTDFEGQDPATGEIQHLVFARPTGQWQELHQIAVEKRPRTSFRRHNAFARACMALTGAYEFGAFGLGSRNCGPTVREYAALRAHGRQNEQGKLILLNFEQAVEFLLAEDGVIFGEITELHCECWMSAFCFDDDPEDVVILSRLTGKEK